MNIKTVYNDFCGRSIKVFVFDFAFRAAVNGVRKVRTEFGNIEICLLYTSDAADE